MLPPQFNRRLPLGSRVEVRIDSLAAGGDGVARIDGCVLFVPEGVPGDRVLVEIAALGPNHARARIVEIREPSLDRRAARCAHFGRCGGCAWQHIEIEAQRAAKVGIVRNALTRIGGIDSALPIAMIASDEYGWRARAVLRVVSVERQKRVGFQRAGSHEVEPIDDCPVLVETLRAELAALHADPSRVPRGAKRLHLAAGDESVRAVFSDDLSQAGAGAPEDVRIQQAVRGRRYAFDALSFFQGHRGLIEPLVDQAVGGATGGTALDLFCGAGLFSLPLGAGFEQVIGIDAEARAIELARANAKQNGVHNVRFECAPVETALRNAGLPARVDYVLLDPPRTGVGEVVVERIAALSPAHVRYVSCDPATLARDLRAFRSNGYELESIVALDLFPQTPHVECVARLAPSSTGPTRSTARSSD